MSTTHAPHGAAAIGSTTGLLAGLALATSLITPLGFEREAAAESFVAGYILQTSPKPNYIYNGSFGSYVSSQLINNGEAHTVMTIDLYGLLTSVGYNAIESVTITDAGNNQYLGSPGADIDLFTFDGLGSDTALTFGYTGPNAQHAAESSALLGSRIGSLDAVSGDQDNNSAHFVSLGKLGALSATFLVPSSSGGGGGGGDGGSGGGSGPNEHPGGGGGEVTWSNLLLVQPGLKLRISEAGSSEGYLIKINASTVPAPGALGLLAALGLRGRGRRRG